ncbi:DUF2809 domain-containing protein [Spirulina subsalsa]|uniref:ribosomal maturation YjgA family protein n=1 Tax=Spirulina subsalsa TaxID=54311 RepID=UPI0002DE3DC9|nr:DUF2809 domain-containing protein [Spirulina subsalsa]
MLRFTHRPRFLTLFYLLLIIPLGLSAKFYQGWGSAWVNDSFSSIFYEMAWCLVFFLIFPRRQAIWPIALGVFLCTSILEFLQLWHPPWLQTIRATLLGRLILGVAFDWSDFLYYVIGSVLGGFLLQHIWALTEGQP